MHTDQHNTLQLQHCLRYYQPHSEGAAGYVVGYHYVRYVSR